MVRSSLVKKTVARHRRCGVYCGARETVGGSSVSSGCWGEDSNHEYGWGRSTPTYVAPIRFYWRLRLQRPMQRLEISINQNARKSEINIGRGIRQDLGQRLLSTLPQPPRQVGIISNKRVFRLYGREVVRSLKAAGFKTFKWLMPEGERYKSFPILEKAVEFLSENRFERNDLVVALGGGVVGDLAGFAAAIYVRGIPVVQVPTTLLAQIDSSVGGKTGINLAVGKNLVGAFHQPVVVCIDTETLLSLPPRELVSGFCEMVKHSLISGEELFQKTGGCLNEVARDREFVASVDFAELIKANCEFKASIVANDERESTARSDAK